MSFKTSEFRVLAEGLGYPEGPVYQSDGSVLLVEIQNGTLTRIPPNGTKQIVATLGGGPNGAAVGPDGAVYVCNDGGMNFMPIPQPPALSPVSVPYGQSATYSGGYIQRVNLNDGTFTTLYSTCNGNKLCSPDDLVFDADRSFWFTDWGKQRAADRDITAVYYAAADGSKITQAIPQRSAPNGIALSPDDKRLYVAETYARWILYWELDSPGVIKSNKPVLDDSHLLTADIPGCGTLDSMAVDEEGNIYVATMLPQGPNPTVAGGITVVSPQGKILDFIELKVEGKPEPLPSNICFGGPDRRTAFITLAGTGRLVSCEMKIPGKKLHFAS
ncbi:MAG: SMP-30/gluconolactonase/LRE family protein [Terriglobales bacterium]